jgi:hypothetical protein
MARSETVETLTALSGRTVVARDYLWITARNRSTGSPEVVGFWSDVGNVAVEVNSPLVGVVTRSFYGSGTLISIDAIAFVANLTVQDVKIRMSQLDDIVAQAVRDYDCKQAKVEIYRGFFDPSTRGLVSPATCLWMGFIDDISIDTPAEGEDGAVVLRCVSHTQEMFRSNPDTRSHESQQVRHPGDTFYADTDVVGDWEHFWGKTKGKIATAKKQGLFGWGGFLGFL